MKKKPEEQEVVDQVTGVPQAEASEAVSAVEVRDLFRREINSSGVVQSLRLKRVLTRPLVSMSRLKELVILCESEMYTMELPLTGRGGGMSSIRVIDVLDLNSNDECILLCHEMVCAALKRAGFRTLGLVQDEKNGDSFPENAGSTLVGVKLALAGGDIKDGKRYRQVNIAELE